MTDQLTATVVIPTYDRAALLAQTLDSLVRQDVPPDRMEVLVADDGSTDETRAVVERYAGVLRLGYHYQPDEGFRVAAARNMGVRHATGDVCVFVDSGVALGRTAVATHLRVHATHPEPVALIGYVYGFEQDDDADDELRPGTDLLDPDAVMDRLAATGQRLDMREGFYRRHDDDIADLPAPWLVYWTCHTSARTDQLREVGMFDEAFTTWGAEDVDLAYRLHRAGARFLVSRTARALHLPHPKSYSDREAGVVANYAYMARKYRTPVMDLLAQVPTIDLLDLNDVLLDQGVVMH